jgi:hypothetical protein
MAYCGRPTTISDIRGSSRLQLSHAQYTVGGAKFAFLLSRPWTPRKPPASLERPKCMQESRNTAVPSFWGLDFIEPGSPRASYIKFSSIWYSCHVFFPYELLLPHFISEFHLRQIFTHYPLRRFLPLSQLPATTKCGVNPSPNPNLGCISVEPPPLLKMPQWRTLTPCLVDSTDKLVAKQQIKTRRPIATSLFTC